MKGRLSGVSRCVIRLPAWQRKAVSLAFSALWLSGVAWLLLHYYLATEGDFGPRPHWLEPWSLRLHGLLAMIVLTVLGSLVPVHMKLAWARARNRAGGLLMVAVCVWLVLTGYALWYFANEANQDWLSRLHWLCGLGLPLILAAHTPVSRRRMMARLGLNWSSAR